MKKILLCSFIIISSFANATEYHVAKDGNDSNAGTESAPFLTISKAASIAVAGDVVTIHEGTYRETVSPANSGTEGSKITFQGAPGEKVIISAMEVIDGFTLDQGSIYKASVNWNLGQRMFVLHNNSPLDLARWPNNVDGDRFTLDAENNTGGSDQNSTSSGYLLSDKIPDLPWEKGGTLFFFGHSRWYGWKFPVTATSSGRVDWQSTHATNAGWIVAAHAPGAYSKVPGEFFLEGIKEALDFQNEWYYDETTKELFVQLPGGIKPADGSIEVSKRENTINIDKKSHIEFRNLAVIGGSIQMNGDNNKLYQISSFYGAMTRGSNLSGLFSNVAAVNIGWRSANNQYANNVIEKCEIAFNDGTGIRAIGQNTLIKNNYIHDCGYLGTYDAPVLPRDGTTTTVTQNTINRAGRDCIQIINKGSEVSYNDISQSNLIADDCGLLYTINKNLNIDIHHNWFHDTFGRGDLYKATGIYLDNDASDVRVYRNVVWNVEWTNIQINWDGQNIDIFNNTFIEGSATMGAWHKEGTSFTNVKVWNNLSDKSDWEPQSDKQNNVTYTTDPFIDKAAGNFIPKEGSVAVDAGREISGYTEGYAGSAPDAGAYETNDNWVAGVDWDLKSGPNGICYGLPGEICNQIEVTNITLEPTSMVLNAIGETATISATIEPENATNKQLKWTSSDPNVATVDANGMVTAVAVGTTAISASTDDGSVSAQANVTVDIIATSHELKVDAAAFPNPQRAGEIVTIDLGHKNTQAKVTIYDASGKMMDKVEMTGQHNIKNLYKKGLYLLDIRFNNGTSITRRIVIH
ncbi:Ig-like domain-containing protein [Marinoscillum furvescens]|uniref:Putative secreted protein (Por secretion system target) n=1 Tax=Marinoscillum furvescens DSM 4134 TaxID=1122208 RepID=A0A3D9KYT0_MARFU|nr:Ig-like domain-containing protein [Marinoscillum furvescens]RED93012.1 putative secreted protein (Por secretion system target) [Marinoscillum furvescens DSM 4134]